MKKLQGKFIAFEGIDFSGKTTQLELLAERLKGLGLDIFVTKEPGSPHFEITQKLRRILLDKKNKQIVSRAELAIFFADRAQHIMEEGGVGEQLQQDKVVLTDRGYGSTFAYQVFGRRIGNLYFINQMNNFFSYGIWPDMNILLDLPVEVAQSRIRSEKNKSRFDKENLEFHQRVKEGYIQLATKIEPERWMIFDGTKPIEEIADEIFERVCNWLKEFLILC